VSIKTFACQRKKDIALLYPPGIGTDSSDHDARRTLAQLAGASLGNELERTWFHYRIGLRCRMAPSGKEASMGSGLPKSINSTGISRTRRSDVGEAISVRLDPSEPQLFALTAATNK
jgi:hypothetical protein